MFFWKRATNEGPDDLKKIEERLRGHARNTQGPSEEFTGRLELRLGHAWDTRALEASGKPAQVASTLYARLRLAGALCACAVLAAGATTFVSQEQHVQQTAGVVLEQRKSVAAPPSARMFESALRAPVLNEMDDHAPAPMVAPQKSVQLNQNVAQSTGLRETPQRNVYMLFFLWIIFYGALFTAILFIARVLKRKLA